MLHIGFTGTRHGMAKAQRIVRAEAEHGPVVAHHGDCIGADAEFHGVCRWVEGVSRTVLHPPTDEKLRAFCAVIKGRDEVLDPLPYMQRNRAIVDASRFMIAAPFEDTPQERGGTWATIRMAWQACKRRGERDRRMIIVGRDGQLLMPTEWGWK